MALLCTEVLRGICEAVRLKTVFLYGAVGGDMSVTYDVVCLVDNLILPMQPMAVSLV